MSKKFFGKLKSLGVKSLAVALCMGSFMSVSPKVAFAQDKGVVCASESKSNEKFDLKDENQNVKLDKKDLEEALESVFKNREDKTKNLKKDNTFGESAKKWVYSFLISLVTPSYVYEVREALNSVGTVRTPLGVINLTCALDAEERSNLCKAYWVGEKMVKCLFWHWFFGLVG